MAASAQDRADDVPRSVEHRGGLDAFLVKASDAELSIDALAIKRDIVKKQAATAA